MNLFIDFDGVIVDFNAQYCKVYNRHHNHQITVKDFTCWELEKCFPGIPLYCAEESFYKNIELIPYVKEYLDKLHFSGSSLYIVTGTVPFRQLGYKYDALKRFFPWMTEQRVITMWDKYLLGDGVLVDDNPNLLLKYSGKKVCVGYEYNKHVKGKVDLWSNNWQEIGKFLLKCS